MVFLASSVDRDGQATLFEFSGDIPLHCIPLVRVYYNNRALMILAYVPPDWMRMIFAFNSGLFTLNNW